MIVKQVLDKSYTTSILHEMNTYLSLTILGYFELLSVQQF